MIRQRYADARAQVAAVWSGEDERPRNAYRRFFFCFRLGIFLL